MSKSIDLLKERMNILADERQGMLNKIKQIDDDLKELQHSVRMLEGPMALPTKPTSPTSTSPAKPAPPAGEKIGEVLMSNGALCAILRPVMADVMEIISKKADNEWFKRGDIQLVIDKHYQGKSRASLDGYGTAYVRFLVEKKVLVHNGKTGSGSAYQKSPRIRRDEPNAIDVVKLLEQERAMMKDVQSR